MMEKCFDEGTLQAFLDNELSSELSQAVARHIVDCDPCAFLLAEVEEETAFAFAALEQEFNTLVPTQRLWTKINESIEIQHRKRSFWQTLLTFISGLSLTNPHVVAFGSLLLIVGVVSALIVFKKDEKVNSIAKNTPQISAPQTTEVNNPSPEIQTPAAPVQTDNSAPKTTVNPQYRVERANFVEAKPNRQPSTTIYRQPQPVVSQYLDGEESYVSTIARLEKTVNENKDEVLKPSARFSYEKDLAVVNDTITKMKKEVKKNPKNEDAKQVLFSSYQNKIELLNSVTQRGELMASMR
ncbi:MAG TPA: zf-HC2 domain-containing protein [Pyrinomonadaceae bacterium]|nr:zf-HC2 domain-containing protein [Pyrinomonadaceae bacterium]